MIEINSILRKKLLKEDIKYYSATQIDELFKRIDELRAIFPDGNILEKIYCRIRWYGSAGIAIRNKIIKLTIEYNKRSHDQIMVNPTIDTVLDFKTVRVNYKGRNQLINDIWKNEHKKNNFGIADLRGINLNNVQFNWLFIKNVNFMYSDFDSILINYCKFENTHFSYSNFFKCSILQSKIINNTSFNNSSFKKTYFAGISFKHFYNSKIDYANTFVFIYYILKNRIRKRSFNPFYGLPFTIIENILDTGEIKSRQIGLERFSRIIDRIELSESITMYESYSNFRVVIYILNILMTKNWTSYINMFFSFLVSNLFFSYLYSQSINGFITDSKEVTLSLLDSFYFSIITITTLGYGDISPHSITVKIMVICEVIFGVIILGLFVNTISGKISTKKYLQ